MARSDKFTAEAKKLVYYSDFMTNLDFHPLTGDLARVTNEEAVKQSIRQLVLTSVTERPYEPFVGSKLYSLLFDPMDSQTTNLIKSTIESTLENNEPRAKPVRVVVQANEGQNLYNVTVIFSIINSQNEVTLNLILKRVR
jgi:phage baseplate assembly protein W